MRYSAMHSMRYIYWQKEAEYTNVSNELWVEKYKSLKASGSVAKTKTMREEYMWGAYRVEKRGAYKYLYFIEARKTEKAKPWGEYLQPIVWTTNVVDDTKNHGTIEPVGRKSIVNVSRIFQERNGVTFRKAFGYVEEGYKKCIPKSFVYLDESIKDRVIGGVASIDGCGQYPASLCGLLPDDHNHKEHTGTVKPTEQYPFAFYLKSGHVAQYGVFDTHDWLKSRFKDYLFNNNRFTDIDPKEDYTVLMKASKYNFNDIMSEFYEKRKTDEMAKLAVNSTIGYFHTNNYKEYKMAHLAAIAIARSNAKMLAMCNKIGFHSVLHVVVDGIIYQKHQTYGLKSKKFGRFHQEFSDCEIIIHGANAYIVKDLQGNLVKVKHGAYNCYEDGTLIIDDEVKEFDEIFRWKKVNYFDDAGGAS